MDKNCEFVHDFGVEGYVRIAYCADRAKVKGALPAFEALTREYGL